MTAFALSDNQPATVIGSGACMYQTDTAGVDVSSVPTSCPQTSSTPSTNAPTTSPSNVSRGVPSHRTAGTTSAFRRRWPTSGGLRALAPFPLSDCTRRLLVGALRWIFTQQWVGYARYLWFTTSLTRAISGYLQSAIRSGSATTRTPKTDVFIGDAAGIGNTVHHHALRTGVCASDDTFVADCNGVPGRSSGFEAVDAAVLAYQQTPVGAQRFPAGDVADQQ